MRIGGAREPHEFVAFWRKASRKQQATFAFTCIEPRAIQAHATGSGNAQKQARVERFKGRFAAAPDTVAVLHSHLSQGERHDEWHKINSGRARIDLAVIGAGSPEGMQVMANLQAGGFKGAIFPVDADGPSAIAALPSAPIASTAASTILSSARDSNSARL